jgi:RNA polymerase sigma-70 factor (ECF subfamily)
VDEPTLATVEAARAGSREAFGLLVECHWARLVRLARSVVGEAEAEDVVQDSLVVAWSKIHQLSEPASFPAWTARIVFRRCLRRARRQRLFVSLEAETVAEPFSDDRGAAVIVWDILARLAPRQRAVLHLTEVEGMTDSEIGKALGITAGSVRSHRRRARERIAGLLQGGRS